MTDELADLAALHALDLLEGDEAAAFERAAAADPELAQLAMELREAAGALALAAPAATPPSRVRRAVLEELAPRRRAATPWIPWAIAAALAACCAFLFAQSRREEPLTLASLAPPPDAPNGPHAALVWNAARQKGDLVIQNLPPAKAGRDFELWAVEKDVPDPVPLGVVRVGSDGAARHAFVLPPDQSARVAAFAISVERAGGVQKKEGPIILLGKL